MKNKNIGVYRIKNIETGRCYIGSSCRINSRRQNHFQNLRANKHGNKNLQADFNASNPDSFVFEILELCSKEELIELEQKYINETMCYLPIFGYNIKSISTRPAEFVMSEERKKELSALNKHRKQVINVTTGEIFLSQREAARSVGVDKSEIKRVCNGIRGRRTCKGFVFEYYNG